METQQEVEVQELEVPEQHIQNLLIQIRLRQIFFYFVLSFNSKNIKKCELGYFIAENETGKGLISKFTSEVVTYCFDILQMNKIFLRIAPDNIRSQKVATHNGFKKEGLLREEYKGFQDKLEDVMYFGLLKADYLNKKNA